MEVSELIPLIGNLGLAIAIVLYYILVDKPRSERRLDEVYEKLLNILEENSEMRHGYKTLGIMVEKMYTKYEVLSSLIHTYKQGDMGSSISTDDFSDIHFDSGGIDEGD